MQTAPHRRARFKPAWSCQSDLEKPTILPAPRLPSPVGNTRIHGRDDRRTGPGWSGDGCPGGFGPGRRSGGPGFPSFGLNEAEPEKTAGFFGQKLTGAGEKKFTLSHQPECGSAEFEPWLAKRWAWFGSSREELRQLIPADKQAAFDQQVEKGGYGFKNMKLKGMPLMFSLGGDPR